MTNKYSLSIIIPAYNSEKIIYDCLNKILEETKNRPKFIIDKIFNKKPESPL